MLCVIRWASARRRTGPVRTAASAWQPPVGACRSPMGDHAAGCRGLLRIPALPASRLTSETGRFLARCAAMASGWIVPSPATSQTSEMPSVLARVTHRARDGSLLPSRQLRTTPSEKPHMRAISVALPTRWISRRMRSEKLPLTAGLGRGRTVRAHARATERETGGWIHADRLAWERVDGTCGEMHELQGCNNGPATSDRLKRLHRRQGRTWFVLKLRPRHN